jgi:hypothetical protein
MRIDWSSRLYGVPVVSYTLPISNLKERMGLSTKRSGLQLQQCEMLMVSCVACVVISALTALAAAQAAPSSAERIAITHAGRAYYSLQRAGVRELRCNAHPGWAEVLASMPATGPDAKARALPYLSKIEFRVTITASITNVSVEPTGQRVPEDLASNLEKLIELVRFNIQQLFDVWRMMTFRPPWPKPEENYRLEHRGGRYRITPSGENTGQIELDENWIILEIRTPILGEQVTVSMQPLYVNSPKGLLLSSLDVRNVDEPSQEIQMNVDYLEREGVQLPAAFGSRSQHPGGVVNIPMKVDHYEIGRR